MDFGSNRLRTVNGSYRKQYDARGLFLRELLVQAARREKLAQVKEIKARKKLAERLLKSQLFSTLRPVKTFFGLAGQMISFRMARSGEQLKLELYIENLDEDKDTDIDDYSLSQLSQHHKSYNIHIGRYNTIINDRVAADKKAAEAEKAKEADTVSDIVEKCNKKEDAYELLRKEFVSVGTLISYTVETGPHQGEINYKQVHEHKHSGYKFTWHHKYGKDTFQKDRIWKAGRYIVSSIYLY